MARKLTDTVQLKLRFGEKLRRRLDQEAKERGRSLNNEIIRRLERSFDYDEWREERLTLIMALRSHPLLTPQEKATMEKHELAEEREFQEDDLPDIAASTKGQ